MVEMESPVSLPTPGHSQKRTEVSMAAKSIAGDGERVTGRERKQCAYCGKNPGRLMMHKPKGLRYEEQKAYKGEYYCNSHLPRFRELPTTSFEPVL
jgi:hypothetical protein